MTSPRSGKVDNQDVPPPLPSPPQSPRNISRKISDRVDMFETLERNSGRKSLTSSNSSASFVAAGTKNSTTEKLEAAAIANENPGLSADEQNVAAREATRRALQLTEEAQDLRNSEANDADDDADDYSTESLSENEEQVGNREPNLINQEGSNTMTQSRADQTTMTTEEVVSQNADATKGASSKRNSKTVTDTVVKTEISGDAGKPSTTVTTEVKAAEGQAPVVDVKAAEGAAVEDNAKPAADASVASKTDKPVVNRYFTWARFRKSALWGFVPSFIGAVVAVAAAPYSSALAEFIPVTTTLVPALANIAVITLVIGAPLAVLAFAVAAIRQRFSKASASEVTVPPAKLEQGVAQSEAVANTASITQTLTNANEAGKKEATVTSSVTTTVDPSNDPANNAKKPSYVLQLVQTPVEVAKKVASGISSTFYADPAKTKAAAITTTTTVEQQQAPTAVK